MKNSPPIDVIRAFDAPPEIESLAGGEDRCWLAGGIVFKPCDEPEMWQWLSEHLPTVKAEGFRLPLPLPANDGRWVVNGWCAQSAVEGYHPKDGKWGEKLHIVDLFHKAVKHLPRPEFIERKNFTNQWVLGDRVAWGEEHVSKDYAPLSHLLNLRTPIVADSQLIHGDFSENILFSQDYTPAVIDISPYWRPVGFSFGIVVADAVCWRKANPETLLRHVSHIEQFPQYLVRALIFRIVTTIAVAKGEPDLTGYTAGIELATKLVS